MLLGCQILQFAFKRLAFAALTFNSALTQTPHLEVSMRFTRRVKFEPVITSRKIAAYKTKLRRDREKFPLFSADIAADQQAGPSVEDVMARRMQQARQWECDWRQREYLWWRRGRSILRQLPAALRSQIRSQWQSARLLPGTATYFLSHIRGCCQTVGINIDLLTPPEFGQDIVDSIGKVA
jgi:hypothetical protein